MQAPVEFTCHNETELPALASAILKAAGKKRVFFLKAPMGAGKTTLIKEFCRQLGSKDHFSSPTYSIVNEYKAEQGSIYHFDLYRVRSLEELMDLGIEEYLSSGNYCFVEWPELFEAYLQAHPQLRALFEPALRVRVSIQADGLDALRKIEWSVI